MTSIYRPDQIRYHRDPKEHPWLDTWYALLPNGDYYIVSYGAALRGDRMSYQGAWLDSDDLPSMEIGVCTPAEVITSYQAALQEVTV